MTGFENILNVLYVSNYIYDICVCIKNQLAKEYVKEQSGLALCIRMYVRTYIRRKEYLVKEMRKIKKTEAEKRKCHLLSFYL